MSRDTKLTLSERVGYFSLGFLYLTALAIIENPKKDLEKEDTADKRGLAADYMRVAFSGERKYKALEFS